MFLLLIDSVIAPYPVDTNRIYLTGLSMGGIGTLDMAIRYPLRFAALIPTRFVSKRAEAYAKERIFLCGLSMEKKDDIIPFSTAQTVINQLVACGGNPIFISYAELYHDSWTKTYNNSAIYEWVLTKSR